MPWFVAWVNGEPEFRAMDTAKWMRAVTERRCWVCGQPLGVWLTFAIGPMCGVNRTTSEPPCHRECAEWSARNCPFLSRPQMVRREDAFSAVARGNTAGVMIDRNPGVVLLWTTKTYEVFDDGRGRPLIAMGDPGAVSWWAAGRRATRGEVEASVCSGLPFLEQACEEESTPNQRREAAAELHRRVAALQTLYPSEAVEAGVS